jgi:anthranilate phosphoribosyltransferase
VPVAKHGNRALSSKSGAADVLEALGVNIELTPDVVARCVREAGIGFMFAPAHHAAMKHVGPSRVELGTRTIFNLLGPLSNPAGVKRLLVGMFSPDWLELAANVLSDLGTEAAWMVHGAGGVDEISIAGKSTVVELKDGRITRFEISPADVGLSEAPLDAVKGGDADVNAKALRALLDGATGPYRDTVLMNAGAALVVAGKANDLAEGVALAAASIDQGKARERLDKLIALSNG